MAHVAPIKKQIADDLARRFAASQVIGVANIHGIPAPQFQSIRKKLAGRATIRVTKNNLLRLALQKASDQKPGLAKLSDVIEGQTAVIMADLNPFRLFKELEATKSRAPARGGEVAPEDLWVREGETPFKPGPIVGDLQKAGIPAAIERGKVVVKKDKLLVKAGERIPREVAQSLARLEIFPLVVGLDLRGVYEGGTVFRRETLSIDDAVVRSQISLAARQALALALEAAYPSPAMIQPLLGKAHRAAVILAIESGFPTKESVKFLLAEAYGHMLSIATRAPDALDDDLRGRLVTQDARPPQEKNPVDKREETKGASEEEAAAGLGALFG